MIIAMKMNELLTNVKSWMNLKLTLLNKTCQTKSMSMYHCIYRKFLKMQIERLWGKTDGCLSGEGKGRITINHRELWGAMHMLIIFFCFFPHHSLSAEITTMARACWASTTTELCRQPIHYLAGGGDFTSVFIYQTYHVVHFKYMLLMTRQLNPSKI